MATVTRVNGGALPGAFYGFQPRFFTVTNITGVHTNSALPESDFEKAVRAIQTVASIVVLGTPAADDFTVAVDNTCATSAADLQVLVRASSTAAAAAVVAEVALTGDALA